MYVALIGFVLLILQIALFFNEARLAAKQFDAQLEMKAEQIGGAVNTFRAMLGGQKQALALAAREALGLNIQYPQYRMMPESAEKFWLADARKLGLDHDFLAIMDMQGGLIKASSNVPEDIVLWLKRLGRPDQRKFGQFNLSGEPFKFVLVPYAYTPKEAYLIAVGSSYKPVEGVLWRHFGYMLASTVLFLLMASLMVRLFVVRVLSAVMQISNTARSITKDNLHARIQVAHADQEIEHLTASLNHMIGRLEKSFTDIREFSLEMAHEVKTPLSVISGESQLALERERTPQEYKETLKCVLKEAKMTQSFVGDLLLLTKLDYRLIQLKFETIDLGELLLETCEYMRLVSLPKGLAIEDEIPPESVFIQGHKIHLRRVFFNLIDNALKFTPAEGRIGVCLRRRGNHAEVLISDTGCGISADEISRVFQKFHKGLGLSIAQSLVDHHGGRLSLQSRPGQGTMFQMEFPLAQSGAVAFKGGN